MTQLPTPPVPDLARASGHTRDEMVNWLLGYYEGQGAPFNYISGTLSIKQGYRGLHNLEQLLAGTNREKLPQGKKSNSDIVNLAAPLSFGRQTRVFDLGTQRFHFGRDLHSGYRIPFFFVEDKTVKLYYLQPRKSFNLTMRQMSMVATIHKKFLLDTEFYGEKCDIEYVDLSADQLTGVREVNTFRLSDLEIWSDRDLTDRLTLISESIEYIKSNSLAEKRVRKSPKINAEMPLFD